MYSYSVALNCTFTWLYMNEALFNDVRDLPDIIQYFILD